MNLPIRTIIASVHRAARDAGITVGEREVGQIVTFFLEELISGPVAAPATDLDRVIRRIADECAGVGAEGGRNRA